MRGWTTTTHVGVVDSLVAGLHLETETEVAPQPSGGVGAEADEVLATHLAGEGELALLLAVVAGQGQSLGVEHGHQHPGGFTVPRKLGWGGFQQMVVQVVVGAHHQGAGGNCTGTITRKSKKERKHNHRNRSLITRVWLRGRRERMK